MSLGIGMQSLNRLLQYVGRLALNQIKFNCIIIQVGDHLIHAMPDRILIWTRIGSGQFAIFRFT
jgi:hypothetical protein